MYRGERPTVMVTLIHVCRQRAGFDLPVACGDRQLTLPNMSLPHEGRGRPVVHWAAPEARAAAPGQRP